MSKTELEILQEEGLIPASIENKDDAPSLDTPLDPPSKSPSTPSYPPDAAPSQVDGGSEGAFNSSTVTEDYYRKILGDWADPDKAVLIPEKLSDYDRLHQEVEELKKKGAPSFANDSVAKFNSFVQKTGISDYGVFKRLESFDPNAATATEKLAMQMILENPSIAGKYEFDKVVKFVENKYNIDPDAHEDDEDVNFGRMSIDLDSAKASDYLQDVKSKLNDFSYEQPEQINFEQLQAEWNPIVKSIADKFTKIDVKFDEKSEGIDFEYHIDSSGKQQIAEETLNYLVSSGAAINKDTIATAQDIITNRYKVQNFSKIIKAFKAKMESDFAKKSADAYNNASDLVNPDANRNIPSSPEKSDADKAFEAEMAGFI